MRGTPQQLVEKYSSLAHDAQLAGDRVAAENFSQHSEHYLRMLNEAQREQAERQAEHQKRQQQHQQNQQQNQQPKQAQAESADPAPAPVQAISDEQPPMAAMPIENDLVETPENQPAPRKARRPRTTKPVEQIEEPKTVETPAAE